MTESEVIIGDALPILATRINHCARRAISLANESLVWVRKCGEALKEAKSKVRHGEWQSWVANNCQYFNLKFAQRAMQIAEYWPEIETKLASSGEPWTMTAALEVVATTRPPKTTALSFLNCDNKSDASTSSPLPERMTPVIGSEMECDDVAAFSVPPTVAMQRAAPEQRQLAEPHDDEGELITRKLSEIATAMGRVKVWSGNRHKRTGGGEAFLAAFGAMHDDLPRIGKLLSAWLDKPTDTRW
jgi:hypothetical protein